MKILKYILPTLLLMFVATGRAEAKRIQKPVYLFGFSASFKDSVVYITDVQDIKGAWMDSKTKHLLGRENYSAQLKDYLTTKLQLKDRVCLVFYAVNKKDAEKQYQKIKAKYTEKAKGAFDVRYLPLGDFRFDAVDMSPEEEDQEP